MKIKVLRKNKINNSLKTEICKLKKTFWNYSLKSHKEWFKKNVRKNDIHILLFNEKQLVGYNLLRKRNYYLELKKRIKKNYYYFDTLIVKKKFRKKNLSKKILDRSLSFSRKTNLPLILICKKKHVNFYKKFSFQLLKKNNFKFMDHKFKFNSMIYSKKINKHLISNKIHIYLN